MNPIELIDGLLQLSRQRVNQILFFLQLGAQLLHLQADVRLVVGPGLFDGCV
jgi:hypothetical protein